MSEKKKNAAKVPMHAQQGDNAALKSTPHPHFSSIGRLYLAKIV